MLTLRAVAARGSSSLAMLALGTVTVLGCVLAVGLSAAASLPAGSADAMVLLGGVALTVQSASTLGSRTPDIALARLRGVRGPRLLWTAVAEPLVVLVAATAAGVALSAAAGPALARRWTGRSSVFELGAAEWTAAAAVLVVALAIVLAVSWRTASEPLHSLLDARYRPRAATTAGPFLTLLVFVGAFVSAYQARQLGSARADWVSFVSPALIGLAIGKLGVWVVGAGCRVASRSVRLNARVYSFLTVRRLSRDSGAVTWMPIVVAGVVVSGVAVTSWLGTQDWSDATARIETGGPNAFVVPTGALQAYVATQGADPRGRWLMAMSATPDQGGGSARDVFVDAARWPRVVGDFYAGTPVDEVTGSIAALGSGSPVAAVRATTATVRFSAASAGRALITARQLRRIRRGVFGYDIVPLQLLVNYVDDHGQAAVVSLPAPPWRFPEPMGRGAVGYTVPLPGCARACAVRDVLVQGRTRDPLHVTSLTFGRQRLLAAGGQGMSAAAVDRQATADVPGGGGLDVRVTDPYNPHPLLAWSRRPAAGIATQGLVLSRAGGEAQAAGLDGESQPVRVVGHAPALPLLGREGLLLDLGTALRGAGGQIPDTVSLVVARADTPAAVLHRLQATGAVGARRTVAAALGRLQRSDAAVRVRLSALVAALVLIVCGISVVSSVGAQRRERRREAAALRTVGVDAASLSRSHRQEAVSLGAAVAAFGFVAAWVGCRALLPVLPLVDSGRFGLRVDSSPRFGVVALVAIAAGVLVAATAHLSLRTVASSSPPQLLQEEGR